MFHEVNMFSLSSTKWKRIRKNITNFQILTIQEALYLHVITKAYSKVQLFSAKQIVIHISVKLRLKLSNEVKVGHSMQVNGALITVAVIPNAFNFSYELNKEVGCLRFRLCFSIPDHPTLISRSYIILFQAWDWVTSPSQKKDY